MDKTDTLNRYRSYRFVYHINKYGYRAMKNRLKKILASLNTGKVIEDEEVSTSIDDTQEGKRLVFNKDKTAALLRKHGLSEDSEVQSNETP